MNPVALAWGFDLAAILAFLMGAPQVAVILAIAAAIVLMDSELDARMRDRRLAARRRNAAAARGHGHGVRRWA